MKSYTQFGFIDTPLSGIIILIRSRLLRGLKDFYLLVQLANEWGNREFSRKVADYACAFLRQRKEKVNPCSQRLHGSSSSLLLHIIFVPRTTTE